MSSGRGRSPCDTGPRELQLDVICPGTFAAASRRNDCSGSAASNLTTSACSAVVRPSSTRRRCRPGASSVAPTPATHRNPRRLRESSDHPTSDRDDITLELRRGTSSAADPSVPQGNDLIASLPTILVLGVWWWILGVPADNERSERPSQFDAQDTVLVGDPPGGPAARSDHDPVRCDDCERDGHGVIIPSTEPETPRQAARATRARDGVGDDHRFVTRTY
jgi:hypothetical protein